MSWTGIAILQVSSVMIMEVGTEDRKMGRKHRDHSAWFRRRWRGPRLGTGLTVCGPALHGARRPANDKERCPGPFRGRAGGLGRRRHGENMQPMRYATGDDGRAPVR